MQTQPGNRKLSELIATVWAQCRVAVHVAQVIILITALPDWLLHADFDARSDLFARDIDVLLEIPNVRSPGYRCTWWFLSHVYIGPRPCRDGAELGPFVLPQPFLSTRLSYWEPDIP